MTTPAARRDGNGNGEITRQAVLAAALDIIDRDGTDALSMRRLARALNRDPMIPYRHAPNKAALLDGVAELERGLDILLTGLTATLTPSHPEPPATLNPQPA